ncbi:Sodium:solute symporter family-domain-containing protein [Mycena rosella]|uniref:Sodium:solute symporter family-domain-containing protein n=1 Tax=Mycena rosella TaxID=1033263 RepID=A0AAD7G520_MYCRO|nr:Sodium:solute symporter family-domain-containing protein [Mycena rosella]
MSTSQIDASAPVLSSGVGYAIVLGMGGGFAVLMLAITKLTTRYSEHSAAESSEEYTSASRSLKPGLIASGIVSAATWAATLLQASTVCLVYGLSGPWWYAAGSSTQIMAFAQNAIQLKLNAPGAHTFLEVIGLRWGTLSHLSFMFFGLGTNIILTSQLITGGANTVNVLTGMNTIAACFLIPVGVVIYTLVGGLRATFFSDYIHTVLIFAIILTVSFSTFTTNRHLGSASEVYELLQTAAVNYPVGHAAGGSYTTMRSLDGFVFGVVVIVSGFGETEINVLVSALNRPDSSHVASKASTSVKGYILGGFAFLPVPWMFATAAGLAMISLSAGPSSLFTAIPLGQAASVAPAAMSALLGKSGAILLLIVLFLAVTSAASAELVAVSSIITYDVYKRYFNPHATDKDILRVSHFGVVGFGIFMGVLGVIFHEIGISLSWLYGFTGTFASAGVFPVCLAIRSKHANKYGCLAGLWIGFTCGIAAWLTTAKAFGGSVNVITTGGVYEQLAGNAGSFFIAGIISMSTTFLFPDDFDFEITRRMNAFQREDVDAEGHVAKHLDGASSDEKVPPGGKEDTLAIDSSLENSDGAHVQNDASDAVLYKDFVLSVWLTIGIFVLLCIFVPAMMVIPRIWSKAGFTFYIVLAFLWTFFAAFIVVVYPVWESRSALARIFRGVLADLTGR